jgi:hypothetical protein
MTIDEAKAHTDQAALLRMSVIIAPSTTATTSKDTPTKDTPTSIAETHGDCIVDKSEEKDKGTTSEVSNLEDIKEGRGIIALNGSAIANILDERATYEKGSPEHISTLRETLFIVPEIPSISGINDVLPEQIVFILFFHTLFFVGKVFGGLTETLDSSFKERFEAVAPALQQEADKAEDVRKIYNFPLKILKGYFEELKKKYMDKGTKGTGSTGSAGSAGAASGGGGDELTFEKFRGMLVTGDPRAVLRFFGKGKNNNSFSISSKATGEGFVPNDDDEELEEDEEDEEDDETNEDDEEEIIETGSDKDLMTKKGILKPSRGIRKEAEKKAKEPMNSNDDKNSEPEVVPSAKRKWQVILDERAGQRVYRENKSGNPLKVRNYVQFMNTTKKGKPEKRDGFVTYDQTKARLKTQVMIRPFHKGRPELSGAAAIRAATDNIEKKDLKADWVSLATKGVRIKESRSLKKPDPALIKTGRRTRKLDRYNKNKKQLSTGDYVEFDTIKDNKGKPWPDGGTKRIRGLVVRENTNGRKQQVYIQKLKDGSLDIDTEHPEVYLKVANEVEKIDPPRTAIPE